jgi:hypothetical protein
VPLDCIILGGFVAVAASYAAAASPVLSALIPSSDCAHLEFSGPVKPLDPALAPVLAERLADLPGYSKTPYGLNRLELVGGIRFMDSVAQTNWLRLSGNGGMNE